MGTLSVSIPELRKIEKGLVAAISPCSTHVSSLKNAVPSVNNAKMESAMQTFCDDWYSRLVEEQGKIRTLSENVRRTAANFEASEQANEAAMKKMKGALR